MEWWGWIATGITAAVAVAGLWLGIRAERRTGFRRLWVVNDSPPSVINATNERCEMVTATLVTASGEFPARVRIVEAGAAVTLKLAKAKPFERATVVVTWHRPDGHWYVWPRREHARLRHDKSHWNEALERPQPWRPNF